MNYEDEVTILKQQVVNLIEQQKADQQMLDTLTEVMRDGFAEVAQLRRDFQIMDERIKDCALELGEHTHMLRAIMQLPAVAGSLPPIPETNKLCVQIFHTSETELTSARLKGGHTEWSLKIEAWHGHKKQAGINVALRPIGKALDILQAKNADLDIIAKVMALPGHALVGIPRRQSAVGGKPYIVDQVITMEQSPFIPLGFKINVFVRSDGVVGHAMLDKFKPANGNAKGKAEAVGFWAP